MKQLEFNFNTRNRYFDTEIERKLFKDFCKFMYSENTRERLKEEEKPYKRIGLYVRKNWDFLYREWQKQLTCQFSQGEIS